MRIAIPASGPCVNDLVDTRFGRAPYIILFTAGTGETMFLPNPYTTKNGEAGSRLVNLMVQNQVTHLITPCIDDHADDALLTTEIRVFLWEGSGTVSSVLEEFKAGKLLMESEKSLAS